jgi:hypothetical protein
MAMNDNLVQKMEFQIEIDRDSDFALLSKEIPAIVSDHLEDFINHCIEKLGLDNQFFILNQLVLDLGVLDIANFKNDLRVKFELQFLEEIKKQINKNSFAKIPDEELTFSIFVFFISNGGRPWWLNSQVRHFGEFAEKSFLLKASKFITHLKFFIKHPVYRKRIIENLSEDLLVRALIHDKKIDNTNSSESIYAIKRFLKHKYRHWNESKISLAFKEIVLQLFLHPHRIDQPWKLNLAIVEAIQDNHSGILTLDFPANSFLRNASSLSELNNFGLSMMEKSKRISSPERDYVLIQGFQFYLENGYTKIGKTDHNYKYQNINTLFRYLISNQLDELTELLLSLGRRSVIKKRFLESISQELLGEFFALMAPSKKKLLTWVVEVFQKVQDEYKPINQTFINVKKSINEITFELFLNKKLSSVNDENYLRFLFKQTARKFGIKYKDLLFFTIKSLEKGNKRTGVFKFSQTMILIYAKDILKSKGTLTVDRAIFGGNRPDARADDYSSKDFIFNLFLDLYRETQQTSESQVGIWLKSKLEVMSLDNTSDLLSLWELFAAKFELGAERLLLPVLVDKHRNPSIQLSAKSFDFWKNKYKLAGIYAQKKPNEFLLIRTLQENKKRLSRKVIKGVLMSLKPVDRVEKLDFQLISNFIHSGVSPMIPIYLNWLEKVLIDSQVQFKKRNVYNWFLQQLLVLPKKDLTLVRLQKKTLEFLQVDEGLMHEVDSTVQKSKSTIEKIQPSKAFHVESQERLFGTYTQQSTQAFFRIVELIGRADVLSIFQDSQKYGDKILFQMLTSKYESQFLNLLKKHQFNKELRDYILIQAPGWLKKDLINFINKASAGSWNAMVTSIRQYIEKTSWIGLKGLYLNDYIEKVLWDQIFDTTTFVIEDLVALVMQQALVEELITNKFWSDYHHFRSLAITGAPVAKSSYVNEIVVLEGSGFLSYIDALSKPQVSGGTSKQILESILIDFHFPIGHSFEDYQVEEFRSYINTLINSDRKVLIDILRNVDSPLVLQRFLAILDESALRFLIRENQNRLGFSLLFKKMEAIFSFFKIKNKTKINSFFTAWIGALYFEIGSLSNLSNVYARMFRVLEAEDVLTHTNVYSQNGWKPLLEILQLDGKDGVLFFEELGWRVSDKKVAQLVDSTDQLVGLPLTEANFKFYLSDLSRVDKRVIGDLLSSVESPILLQRLLKLLDESTLRFLIQDQHDILGFSSLLKQIEAVFSLFKIKNKAQRIDFFSVWIGVLYFAKPDKTSRISVYGRLFRALASEGILEKHAQISGIEQRSLIDIFGLEGGEEIRFFEEFGWRVSDKKVAQLVDSTDQLVGIPLTEANFKSYLSDLSRVDKRVIGDLLSSVESPILLQRLLKLLDESTLRFLIQGQHDILGFSSLLKQIEAVFSLFKIKNKAQRIDFFTVWIGVLYFAKPDKTSRISVYGRLFRVLASEGILGSDVFISDIDQKSLIDILQLDRYDEVLFLKELGGQNRILKSVEVPEKTSDSTDDFLHGKNPIQLILYPNNLSFEQYKLFIEYLFEEGILVYSHRTYIQEWMTFSTQYRSKKYLQTIVRLYFLNNLKFNSSATSMKAMLLYAFMENLNSDRYELRLFFSRLSFMPSLIWGIPWVLMEDMRKADLRKWKKVWLEVNANSSIDLESEDWHALSFNLLMNYGKSFVENQQNFRNRIPYLSKLISEAPLSELFMYRIHPDLFHEFLKIKPAKEIQNYFLEGRDPYLKLLKEKEFLITWFEGFFESSNEIQKAKFLGLFHKSFYSNVYTNTQQNLNTFLKGFFRLQEGQKSFWKVVEKKPEKTALFAQVYPEFFGNIKPITKTSVALLSPMEIFQMFLETGMLPKGMSGFQHLARDLSDFRENDLKKLRIVVHAGLQSEKGRQNFYKFATYVDLTWFLKLIHQDLPKELDELISHVNKKVQLDIFADLRISKKLDRLIFIAARWSGRGVLIKSPTEILLGIVEKWVDLVDSEVIRQVFSSDHHTPESVTIQKNSSSKLKRVIDELATVEEKEMVQMPPVEIEPIDYGEGVSIANAGLILFWPFYGRFFNALGMVGKEGMKGEKIRERAIQLLQYIATGRTEFEEWDLTLNKILCGATPDFPVSPSIDISAEEEELCGKLIKGSIYNWEKMRGTRMETFRETFVAREGRLYRKENRWELIVDKKAYDVLLDTLTWNISMINLSWMNTRINVQWR